MMRDKFPKMIPYIQGGMLVILLIFIIFLNLSDKNSLTPIETVRKNVEESVDLNGMHINSNRMFKRFYGLNAGDYEGVCLYTADSNMDAEELLIVKLKDSSQREAVESAVRKRLDSRMESFDGYGVQQYKLLEEHILNVHGNYIFYAVHKDAAKAEQAFLRCL